MPVDRTIGVNDLVGSRAQRLRQRVSLTVGLTATKSLPTVGNRPTEGPLLDRAPIVAIGVRMSPALRLSTGIAVFEVANQNALSGAKELGVAPFFGGSLDIDVIALAKGKLL